MLSFMIDMPLLVVIGMLLALPPVVLVMVCGFSVMLFEDRQRIYREMRAELSDDDRRATIINVVYEPFVNEKFARNRRELFTAIGLLLISDGEAKLILKSPLLLDPHYYDPRVINLDPQRERIHLNGSRIFFHRELRDWIAIGPVDQPKSLLGPDTRAFPSLSKADMHAFYERLVQVLPLDESTRLTHCPSCRYLLAGNTTGICPECGTNFLPTANWPSMMLVNDKKKDA